MVVYLTLPPYVSQPGGRLDTFTPRSSRHLLHSYFPSAWVRTSSRGELLWWRIWYIINKEKRRQKIQDKEEELRRGIKKKQKKNKRERERERESGEEESVEKVRKQRPLATCYKQDPVTDKCEKAAERTEENKLGR